MANTYNIKGNGSDVKFTVHVLPDTDWSVSASTNVIQDNNTLVNQVTGNGTTALDLVIDSNQSSQPRTIDVKTEITSKECSGVTETTEFVQEPLWIVTATKDSHTYPPNIRGGLVQTYTSDSYKLEVKYDNFPNIGASFTSSSFIIELNDEYFEEEDTNTLINFLSSNTNTFCDAIQVAPYALMVRLDGDSYNNETVFVDNKSIILTTIQNKQYTITIDIRKYEP